VKDQKIVVYGKGMDACERPQSMGDFVEATRQQWRDMLMMMMVVIMMMMTATTFSGF